MSACDASSETWYARRDGDEKELDKLGRNQGKGKVKEIKITSP
jgi:hypothetical protein